jgi:hypothetical protein
MKLLLKTKKDREQFMDWIVALQMEVLPQSTGGLQNSKGYCCLGVACAVTIPEYKLVKSYGNMHGLFPCAQQHAPLWLMGINVDFGIKTAKHSLSVLNDEYLLSFPEIARRLLEVYKDELSYQKYL